MLCAILVATDFWRAIAGAPYQAALQEGTRLSRQAAEICPGCSPGASRFAEMQALWRQAAAAFRRAADALPDDPDAPYLAAHALQEARDYEDAIRAYQGARARAPEGARAADVAFELGTALSRLAQFDRAREEYARAMHWARDPAERAVLYINSAETMMALGQVGDAIPLYQRGIDAGALAMKSGALSSGSQALHLLGLAVALDRDEQGEKALATTRRALELDSQISQLHEAHVFFVPEGDVAYYDALKALAQGNRGDAAHGFAEFVRRVPQSPFLARARMHLRALGGVAEPRPARPSAERSLTGGVVLATGPLLAPELDAQLKPLQGAIASCLSDHTGALRLKIRIAPSGKVERLTLAPRAPQAEACLRREAAGWRFRAADQPRPTDLTYRVLAP
jgi:tetratricopeptide (TPR) repeat protein